MLPGNVHANKKSFIDVIYLCFFFYAQVFDSNNQSYQTDDHHTLATMLTKKESLLVRPFVLKKYENHRRKVREYIYLLIFVRI